MEREFIPQTLKEIKYKNMKLLNVEESSGAAIPTKRGRGRPRKQETIQVQIASAPERRGRKPRFRLPEMPRLNKGCKEKISISFPLDKDCIAKTEFDHISFIYPKLSEFPCRKLGDSNNPRSHDESGDFLKNPVMQAAEQTLRENPENFHRINRGLTILAESFEYKNGRATITISNSNHGTADGASTESLIAKAQLQIAKAKENNASLPEEEREEIPDFLERGRLRIEVITGITDHDLIAEIVGARNSSRQVKGFSMANFKGSFDFLKNELEKPDAPFRGKISYDENADGFSILNVLSILNLFHPEYNLPSVDGKLKAPTISYSGKGNLPMRLENEELRKGYESLTSLLNEILYLYEYIYSNFETVYASAFHNKVKLGRRIGFETRRLSDKKQVLPLTNMVSNYVIENGILYPLVNAFRSLIKFKKDGTAKWRQSPTKFFDKHGPRLVSHLIEELDAIGTPNALGKSTRSYVALAREVNLIIADEFMATATGE